MGMNLSLTSLVQNLASRLLGVKRHSRQPRESSDVTREVEALEKRQLLTVYSVTTSVDETDDPTTTSLRDAINLANANPGPDEIRFAANQSGQRVLLTQGELVITDPVTITGLGSYHTVVDGQLNSRVFNILDSAGNVTIESLTVAQGRTEDFNGRGAGIISNSNGTLTLKDATVIGNFTTGAFAQGGGIFSYVGAVTLIDSTVSGNGTTGGSAPGGGISTGTGNITLINSTISGNVTNGPNSGGGGIATYTGNIKLTNTTVAFNGTLNLNSPGGGIFSGGTGLTKSNTITLNNSIVGSNRITSGQAIDISKGAGTSSLVANNSLISINPGTGLTPAPLGSPDANGNLIGGFASPIDPQLLPLATNGGTTRTHALANTSPAINAGNNSLALLKGSTALTEDQAGQIRIFHNTIDMGAFELQTVSVVPNVSFSLTSQSADEGAGVATLTVVLSAASSNAVTIPFTLSGTATSGADYLISTSSITIPAGSLTASIQVALTDDNDVEGDETVLVTLGTPTNATLGSQSSNTLTITDNDSEAPTSITLSSNSVTENATNVLVGTLTAINSSSTGAPTFTILPGNQASSFTIVNSQLRVGSQSLDFESLNGGAALVTVRATNPNGTYSDQQFSIVVKNLNEKPTISAGQEFIALPGSAAGTVVGTVQVTDPDRVSTFNKLTYKIIKGNAGNAFAINPLTGQITVATPRYVGSTGKKLTLQIRVYDVSDKNVYTTQTVKVQMGVPYTVVVPASAGAIATSMNAAAALSPSAALANVSQTASLSTAKLTVSTIGGGSLRDTLFIKDGGSFTLQGSKLRVNGVTVATVSGGTAGKSLTIKFLSGSASLINDVLSQISVVTARITGAQAQRTFQFMITAGSFSSSATVKANVVNSSST